MNRTKPRIAVVLCNLGGPDSLAAVRPFLFNLFHDRAILAVPQPIRYCLAQLISAVRAPTARKIYAQIGGSSPLLAETERQARALESDLTARGLDARVFVAMRYWQPTSDDAAVAVAEYAPDRVILLPLYPQFSTSTTASSIDAWRLAAQRVKLSVPTRAVCCFPSNAGWVAAVASGVGAALGKASRGGQPVRVLFSAHGLPERIVRRGDPYPWQVERTVAAVVAAMPTPPADVVICYQSRVGPVAWIGPSTEAELERAGRDGVAVVIVPISFVSEHSETLVELDIEYRHKAAECGIAVYERVPTVGCAAPFIRGLADMVVEAADGAEGIYPDGGERICPAAHRACPCRQPPQAMELADE